MKSGSAGMKTVITLAAWLAAFSPAPARSVTLFWTAPDDTDLAGTLLLFSTERFPASPADGRPVPNGAGGVFPAAPGAACSFAHGDLDSAATYYYAAFAFDDARNYGPPAFLAMPPEVPEGPEEPAPAEEPAPDPAYLRVGGARPNPFNGAAWFDVEVRAGQAVRVEVFDAAGRSVAKLVDDRVPPGTRWVAWDGRNRFGREAPGGVYFVRVRTDRATITKKVLLLR